MKTAVVFPGQGSQSLGMLAELAGIRSEIRETFTQASDVLHEDLWSLSQNGPRTELDRTVNTQPLMLAAGVAVWHVWRNENGCSPALLAGHSLGEYTALVCAGAIEYEAAVRLVRERARLMQAAVAEGEGAMAAVLGLDEAEVVAICTRAAEGAKADKMIVEAANFNAPGQTVIAGETRAVERAMQLAERAGAKRVLSLPVSVPSHCALMQPAARRLAKRLAEVPISPVRIPVIHNADAQSHSEPSAIADVLGRQLFSPVRWVETVRHIAAQGVTAVLEFGPGKVLAGLNKRIDKSLETLCVQDPASLEKALGLYGKINES